MRYLRSTIPFILLAAMYFQALPHSSAADSGQSAQPVFGPQTFTRSSANQDLFSQPVSVADTSVPYTLTVMNGASDGSSRVRRIWITLNGQVILGPSILNSGSSGVTMAINPQPQNELTIQLKGGSAGSFITVTLGPTPSTVLNDPSSPDFDLNEAGLGTPYGVAIDQSSHVAYVADRYYDTVFSFDISGARIAGSVRGVDGDSVFGDGGTTGIRFVSSTEQVFASNVGMDINLAGSLAVIDPIGGFPRVIPMTYSGQPLHPQFLAVNSTGNTAAVTTLYDPNNLIYLVDLGTGAITGKQPPAEATAPAYNPTTKQFVFAAAGSGNPSVLLYKAQPPFKFVKQIPSTAPAGTQFEKIAINQNTNVAVAVDQQDSAVYVFDLTGAKQVARIPIHVGSFQYGSADIAVNPVTNMVVVTSTFIDHITVINLAHQFITAEIPLPPGARPLGVDIDHGLNYAVIAENGLSSNTRNGSIFVVQLPSF